MNQIESGCLGLAGDKYDSEKLNKFNRVELSFVSFSIETQLLSVRIY